MTPRVGRVLNHMFANVVPSNINIILNIINNCIIYTRLGAISSTETSFSIFMKQKYFEVTSFSEILSAGIRSPDGIIFESVNEALENPPRRGILGYDRKLRRINKAVIDLENVIDLNSNQTFIEPDYAAETGRILSLPPKKPKAVVLSSFMRSGT